MKISIRSMMLMIGMLGLMVNACSKNNQKPESTSDNKSLEQQIKREVLDREQLISMIFPNSWQEQLNLNAEAQMQMADVEKNLYIIVIAESKEALVGMQRQNYIDEGNKVMMAALKNSRLIGPREVRLGRKADIAATEHEIRGDFETSEGSIQANYILTIVEADKHYFQILAWSNQESFARYRAQLDEIIKSFEIKKR